MDERQPIKESGLKELIEAQLLECTADQKSMFEKYRTPLQKARIARFGKVEEVLVVAKNGAEVMYYDDVEEGFNFSLISQAGDVLEPGGNQDELKYALWHWQ